MVDEMLIAGKEWLPQCSREIPLAEKRLKDSTLLLHPSKGFRQAAQFKDIRASIGVEDIC